MADAILIIPDAVKCCLEGCNIMIPLANNRRFKYRYGYRDFYCGVPHRNIGTKPNTSHFYKKRALPVLPELAY